jgi:hypothetical protein
MAETLKNSIAFVGIDIGKNSFHVVGLDKSGVIVLRQNWSRGQVETRFANMPPCLIGMEACVGAHQIRAYLLERGVAVRHVLIHGRGDDGQNLVISRAYISRGFRDRAAFGEGAFEGHLTASTPGGERADRGVRQSHFRKPGRFTPLLSALPLSNHSVGLHSPCTLRGPLSLVYRPLGLRSPLGQLHPRELQRRAKARASVLLLHEVRVLSREMRARLAATLLRSCLEATFPGYRRFEVKRF